MWARVVEMMMGVWLLMSPFIFRHDPMDTALWTVDLVCGSLLILLAALSCWEPTRYAHVTELAIALVLIGFGYFTGGHPSAPGYQNDIFIGLTVMFFAIIPNEATQPPRSWREYYHRRQATQTKKARSSV